MIVNIERKVIKEGVIEEVMTFYPSKKAYEERDENAVVEPCANFIHEVTDEKYYHPEEDTN